MNVTVNELLCPYSIVPSVLVDRKKLVGFVPPSVRELTVIGTWSPPVFCTQNVCTSVRLTSTSPKFFSSGVITRSGSPSRAGQTDDTRTSSNRPPPSQSVPLPAFRRRAVTWAMDMDDHSTSHVAGSVDGMFSPR